MRRIEHRAARSALRAFAPATAILVGAACGRGGPAAPQQPPSTVWTPIGPEFVLYSDNSGGIRDSMLVAIPTADSLGAVVARAASNQPTPPPIELVDFEKDMVVLVAVGRRTANDRVRVDSVGFGYELTIGRKLQDVTYVVVRVYEACRRVGSDAYPLQLVRIPRSPAPDAQLRWLERPPVRDCAAP